MCVKTRMGSSPITRTIYLYNNITNAFHMEVKVLFCTYFLFMELKYIVDNLSNYTTVRQVLKNEFNMSNRLITKLKQNKFIYLNDTETYLDKLLSIGDIIKCRIDFNESSENIVPTKMTLKIIYEDDYLLVVDKPSNMAVHPSVLHYTNTLSNGVKHYFESIGLNRKIRPVNRLDRDTTGIVLFAKNEYIQECLIKQMQNRYFLQRIFGDFGRNTREKKWHN